MNLDIPIAAAIGCSICNGVSTVLQKRGADEEKKIKSVQIISMLKFLKNKAYVWGILFALFGWLLSVVALQELPLFLVQSITAASIIVTAIGETMLTHRPIGKRTYGYILLVITGLALLSISASPSKAVIRSPGVHLIIVIAPILLAIVGVIFVYLKQRSSYIALALISGMSFGGTSIVARVITLSDDKISYLWNPLVWALVAYGLLGEYFFTVALQRASGTASNALMVSMQTFFPAVFGLIYLQDKIRNHYQAAVLIGTVLVVVSCLMIAKVDRDIPQTVAR